MFNFNYLLLMVVTQISPFFATFSVYFLCS